jgi:methyl-accepting chemotaxis protein
MMVLGVGMVLCFSMVLIWAYKRIETKIYEDRQAQIRGVTEVAFSLMTEYEARIKTGELTLEEAKKRAALRVKNLRYSGQEYFWINDLTPRMVMHPFRPELDGQDLSGSKDPDGKALFVEMVRTCKENGAGFVDYMWPKPGASKPVPKISFVKLFEPWGWIVGSGVYVDDIEAELSIIRRAFLGAALFLGIGGLLLTWLLARKTARPIMGAVDGLLASSDSIAAAAVQISSASQQLAEGASEQAAAIEETSASLEEIASTTRKNAENAGYADKLMKNTNEIVERANHSMQSLTSSMTEISGASEQTQKIVKTIDEIAFQTNLLALNAAVEAARAGEAGAGFAVVADEVRNLAMRAAESARSTGELIESTVKKIRVGVDLVQQTNQEFNEVTSMVTKSGELVGEIAAASHEQAQGIDHLNQAVQEMDKVVQRNAASAEETASITGEMNAQSALVKDMVGGLATLVGSGAHSADVSGKQDGAPPKAANPPRRSVQAGRPSAKNGGNGNRSAVMKTTPKQLPPERVIPFEEDFRDF